jgi:hypothetical protein
MAQVLKKSFIPRSSLPTVRGDSNNYILRFRIVSEDRNRTSHWSPLFEVSASILDPDETKLYLDVTTSSKTGNKTLSAIWNLPEFYENSSFDIYLRWLGSNYETENYEWRYVGTKQAPEFSTVIPDTTSYVDSAGDIQTVPIVYLQIRAQTPTYPKQLFDSAKVFESAITEI